MMRLVAADSSFVSHARVEDEEDAPHKREETLEVTRTE